MGLPPSAQAGYPKLAGAFCHAKSWSYSARCRLGSRETWAIRTWHSHARSWSYLARFRLGRRENVGNSNVASPTPNPGRTWPGAGWAVGKCGQFDRGIPHAQSWSCLARCRLVRRENVGYSNVASPTPNPGRTWPGAGWSVGKMWAIRTWHLPRRILVVLGHVLAGQSGIFVQFERGISHAQSWSYLARCRLVRRENVGNSNVACPKPNPGRTWPGAGWASGKCGQFDRGIPHAQSWSYLARCRLGRRENVGNSNVASPTPNSGRTWPGAGWAVGKTWAIRSWHSPRPILVVLGQVQAGPSGKCGQFERGIPHAESWSYLARCWLVRWENVGNSNVASPTPNPGRTWPCFGWAVGNILQFECGISHAQS
jgi:hypothetical protein